jgi:hypothetical protein
VKAHAASNFAPGTPPYATSTAFSNTQGGWVGRVGLEMDDYEQLAVAR